MSLKSRLLVFGLIILSGWPLTSQPVLAQTLSNRLAGRILLQVESRGEAWYVNPLDEKRYYLGRPDDAFALMKRLSLGISEAEFASWNKGAPVWAKGRLFLRPESRGEAYYVDLNQRWHYLGRPLDAWLLFRAQGLGITNSDLAKIVIAPQTGVVAPTTPINNTQGDYVSTLSWKYLQEGFRHDLKLSSTLNNTYLNSLKTVYYNSEANRVSVRDQFYGLFFNFKTGDNAVANLVDYGRQMGASRSWTNDQIAEFLMSLVQFIPYDSSKLSQPTIIPNYPYETLYRNSGVCSDKTFLAVSILRSLGYGAAILDFPDKNHSAAGIACPVQDSLAGSGYCYVETTNYFPLGVVPPTLEAGQAVTEADNLSNLFDATRMGKMEIYQKTSGAVYQGLAKVKGQAASLINLRVWLNSENSSLEARLATLQAKIKLIQDKKTKLDYYLSQGDFISYNALVEEYNQDVTSYNTDLEAYRVALSRYNAEVARYNQEMSAFYQK